jgi:predicted ester cyclase
VDERSTAISDRPENLRLAYQETCNSHAGLTDFRAKLLALLPIASGAGIFLLLRGRTTGELGDVLPAIGLFGVAVTLGLFIYEYRGIETCVDLRVRAKKLEAELQIPAGMAQFRDAKGPLRGILAVEGASWVVYLAVLLGWVYLAGAADSWWEGWGGYRWLILPAFGVIVLALKFLIVPKFRGRRNRDAVRRLYEAWKAGDQKLLKELIGPDAIDWTPNYPFRPSQMTDGPMATLSIYRVAFPALSLSIEDTYKDGDIVVTHTTARGTHEGDLPGLPATGKHATVSGVFISRFVRGKIVEHWWYGDVLGLLGQLGVGPVGELPPPRTSA